MAGKTEPKPALFSPQWWELRRAVMEEIQASQARLRREHKLVGDNDPLLQRLLQERSDAAMALALYGRNSRTGTGDDADLERAWDRAARTAVEHYVAGLEKAA